MLIINKIDNYLVLKKLYKALIISFIFK